MTSQLQPPLSFICDGGFQCGKMQGHADFQNPKTTNSETQASQWAVNASVAQAESDKALDIHALEYRA